MSGESVPLKALLRDTEARWLVTGVAGFIGSNLLETLLRGGQTVVGLDSFFSGKRANLEHVRQLVGPDAWARFQFVEGDIRDAGLLRRTLPGTDYVLHQAALGSVPRSLNEPELCHDINVTGFLNVLNAARAVSVRRVVYASSSAVYGDDPADSKCEDTIGRPLSPYAASKWMNEIYAGVFTRAYGLGTVGLRYFNIYGPRQDPQGAYAAVIPKWISALLTREPVRIHGDGETSRDFCYILDVVQANLRAALTGGPQVEGAVFNVASGHRTTLNELFKALKQALAGEDPSLNQLEPVYGEFRAGDIRHSLADIRRARAALDYQPTFELPQGLHAALGWYRQDPNHLP
ncbi:MAG: SDR family oxidoreductase [Verrucomicrobia bacterium]|jgi:UDP-N-acetylglucosamine 4-epimerase|nr:SDR family oxidoreductase [Verrucomicrobiota bacterium]